VAWIQTNHPISISVLDAPHTTNTAMAIINTTHISINGGLHVGGVSDPGDNNLLVDGTITSIKKYISDSSILGSELVNNSAFTSDATGWAQGWETAYVVPGTLASIAGGQSGNCLSITNPSDKYGHAVQIVAVKSYTTYIFSVYHKNGTYYGDIHVGTTQWDGTYYNLHNNNDADWTLRSVTFTTGAVTEVYITLGVSVNTNGSTTLYDSVTLKEVTGGNLALNGKITAYSGSLGIKVDGSGNASIDGNVEIDGALNHDGTTVGFYGVVPVVKGAGLTAQLTTITHSAPGTPDYALQDLVQNTGFGFVTKDEGNSTLAVIANLQARVAQLEARLGSTTGVGLFT